MNFEEKTCGEKLADRAEVPEVLAELCQLVADNMLIHAKWVGTSTPQAAAEHDALSHIAREYRTMAAAAERAAAIMQSQHGLPTAPHDHSRLDRPAQARILRRQLELQRRLADLLVSHAEASRSELLELELSAEV
jgi:hypothetical protein